MQVANFMTTIEIRTPQNVTIEYELAALKDRFAALMLDIVIVFAVYFLLMFFIFQVAGVVLGGMMGRVIAFVPLLLFFFYQFLFEMLQDGQSLGKKALGIKVVRLDGREPGIGEYLLRAIFHMLDTLASFGILGAILISASPNRQRLGDMTANTTVIKLRFNMRFNLQDIMNISTIDDYEVTYPAVKNLSEQDMLLIKNIISRYAKYNNPAHQSAISELTTKLMTELDIKKYPDNKIIFLKTLIRDYIVMTR